jgi:D-xylose transport system substrate-binding protein
MRLKNPLFLIFSLFLALPFLSGWGHWGPKVKIGLSLDQALGREALVKNLKEEFEDNRAELVLMDAKGNPKTQEAQVRDLIAQGIQALVILPCDPSKSRPLVETAHKAGIKVISLERLIPNSGLDYLVVFDGEKAGELQAKAMVKRVPRGRYMLLGRDSADAVCRDIQEGQMKVLKPLIDRGDIQIVALPKSRKFPKSLKGIDAVLASNNEKTEQIIQAMEKEGLTGKVLVAGIGDDLNSCRRIVSGTQIMTVYHPPKKLAEETAYLAAKVGRKATQFDCQFTELDNGDSKILAVFLTPLAVDVKNLDSTVIRDQGYKKEDVSGK